MTEASLVSSLTLPLLLLPALGVGLAVGTALLSVAEARRGQAGLSQAPHASAGMQVFLAIPMTLLVFGLALLILYGRLAERGVPEAFLSLGALTYGLSAAIVALGYAIVFHRGVGRSLLQKGVLGPTVVLSAVVETPLLLALFFGILLPEAALTHPAPEILVTAARTSALYVTLGSLASPFSAILATTSWDFTSVPGWGPAVAKAGAGLVPGIALFALALVTLLG